MSNICLNMLLVYSVQELIKYQTLVKICSKKKYNKYIILKMPISYNY